MTLIDVTVVICAYTMRRWDEIVLAVRSVEAQQRSGLLGAVDLVLVLDHDDELLVRASDRWPDHTVVANTGARGLSGARNTGVALASGDVVAFLDDDAAADPAWLATLVRHFADPTVAGVGGFVRPRWGGPEPDWLPDEFRWVVGCSYRGLPETVAEVRNPIGANMAFRRSALAEAGAFTDGIGRVGTRPLGCEETELSIRIRARGHRVLHDPDAVVDHLVTPERTTLGYFLRRCWAEGISKALVVEASGAGAGLSAERRHLTRVLPRAVVDHVITAARGPGRRTAAAQAGALLVGVVATAGGFARGAVAR